MDEATLPKNWHGAAVRELRSELGAGHLGHLRFAVFAADGGVGVSTVTAVLSQVLAVVAAREVVAVDNSGSLLSHLGRRLVDGGLGSTVRDVLGRATSDSTPQALLHDVRPGAAGVRLLAGGDSLTAADTAALMAALDRCGASVWDLGRMPGEQIALVCAYSHPVLLARPTRAGLESALSAASAMRAAGLADAVGRTQVVLVSTGAPRDREMAAPLRHLSTQVLGVSELRQEKALSAGGNLHPSTLPRHAIDTVAAVIQTALNSTKPDTKGTTK